MLKKRRFEGGFFLGIFLLLSFIMWCTPMSSDDFEFAKLNLPSLRALLRYVVYYGNGRVLGNLTSIILVKLPLLAIAVKSFVLTAVIWLLPRVLHFRGLRYDLCSFLLVLGINPALFGEVYTWNCGFGNYTPPIFITLLIVFLLQNYPKKRLGKIAVCMTVFSLGGASQLFVEHSALINILLAALFVCKSFQQKKASRFAALLWLAATVLGGIALVLIPKVFYIANNRVGSYRSVNIGSLGTLLRSCADNAIVLLNDCIGTFGLLLSGGAMLSVHLTRAERSKKLQHFLMGLAGSSMCYILLNGFMHADTFLVDNAFYGEIFPHEYAIRIFTAIMILLPLSIWLYAARKNKPVMLLLFFAILSMLMLLPVSPTPTRVVFQSYLFVAMAFLCCLSSLPLPRKRSFTRVLCVLCCALTLLLATVFFNCRMMDRVRRNHIESELAAGKTRIAIFEIPYRYVFWDSQWSMHRYYDPSGNTIFEMLDYTVWQILYQ